MELKQMNEWIMGKWNILASNRRDLPLETGEWSLQLKSGGRKSSGKKPSKKRKVEKTFAVSVELEALLESENIRKTHLNSIVALFPALCWPISFFPFE